MAVTAGVGHFVSWNGGCLFIGRDVGVVPVHAHYSIQITIGSEPGVRFRTNDREPWTSYAGAIIPSRQPHAMDASAVQANAVIFVEPETREGHALAERFLAGGIASLPEALISDVRQAVFDRWREQRSEEAIAQAARDVIQRLTGGVIPREVSDERVLRAIAFINANLDRSLTLEEVAAEAFLSPSRFRHLFVEQTGMALRPYMLWRRFLKVWELLMAGESLSTAAHRAGFADSAHLTRTSRRVFGFPPSAMQIAGPLANAAPTASQPLRTRT
jgi:AraC family transcriptional regulator